MSRRIQPFVPPLLDALWPFHQQPRVFLYLQRRLASDDVLVVDKWDRLVSIWPPELTSGAVAPGRFPGCCRAARARDY